MFKRLTRDLSSNGVKIRQNGNKPNDRVQSTYEVRSDTENDFDPDTVKVKMRSTHTLPQNFQSKKVSVTFSPDTNHNLSNSMGCIIVRKKWGRIQQSLSTKNINEVENFQDEEKQNNIHNDDDDDDDNQTGPRPVIRIKKAYTRTELPNHSPEPQSCPPLPTNARPFRWSRIEPRISFKYAVDGPTPHINYSIPSITYRTRLRRSLAPN